MARICAAKRCEDSLEGKRRDALYCSQRCQHRARRRRLGMREVELPLSPYWREYLRRFDLALRERTPAAWLACHELVPSRERRYPNGFYRYTELARLLRSLEEEE